MSRATFMYSRLVFFLIDKLDFKEPGIKKKKKKKKKKRRNCFSGKIFHSVNATTSSKTRKIKNSYLQISCLKVLGKAVASVFLLQKQVSSHN